MLNNVVGYWVYIRGTYICWAYIRVGLYSGGLIFGGGGGGGGAYSRRFTVYALRGITLRVAVKARQLDSVGIERCAGISGSQVRFLPEGP
jgi:hypothetical protein